MKFILLTAFLSLASASENFKVYSRALEVPENPDEWVFKGGNESDTRESNNPVRGGRVSGGNTAYDTQFPWVAQMGINLKNGGLRCTAALIKSNWIVGARHCIADTNAVSVQASLGSADEQRFRVKVFSDQFVWLNVNTGEHPDIALFRLTSNLALDSYVNVVRVPSRAQKDFKFEGYVMTAAGWGGDGTGGLPRYLQWTDFKIEYERDCKLGTYYICSKSPTRKSSLQGGDSGGPSVVYENGTPTLVGINVIGVGDAFGSTRVSSFLDFISDVTGLVIRSS